MVFLQESAKFGVGCEIDGLIGALTERRQGYTTVECSETFFFDDGVEGVCGVAVFRDVERIGHGVVLGLKSDFDDLHGRDDGDGFCYAGGEASWSVLAYVRMF